MRQGIGSVALYNIIIVFIIVTFAILSGTMSYSKAFKVNNKVINAIEKYEGYNEYSANDIQNQLLSVGYESRGRSTCTSRNGEAPLDLSEYQLDYDFCLYMYPLESTEWGNDGVHETRFVQYGVVSYIYIDFLGLGGLIKVPVYSASRKMFTFDPAFYSPKATVGNSDLEIIKREDLISNLNTSISVPQSINDLKSYFVVYVPDGSMKTLTEDFTVAVAPSREGNYTKCTVTISSVKDSPSFSYLVDLGKSCTQ